MTFSFHRFGDLRRKTVLRIFSALHFLFFYISCTSNGSLFISWFLFFSVTGTKWGFVAFRGGGGVREHGRGSKI